ncbi:hypothetical protein VNI00_019464 [Paramarasmius palmivorus]|uniref:Uncharacterized protein n=1 Tax=Paramarasmius palmivorus TaxID=297713 RepID=A0AAW0AM68_9AGAR
MPWAKVRKSVAARRKENREKSARHYARHRENILAWKKAARQLAAREDEIARLKERTERRNEKESGGSSAVRKQERKNSRLEADFQRVSESLARYTQGLPSRFLEQLCIQYISQFPSSESSARFVLESAESHINDFMKTCYRLEGDVLQEKGANEDYFRAHNLTKQVKCILDCIVNMEMTALDPDEDLGKAFRAKKLQFQRASVEGWINGTSSIPE